MKKGYRKFLVPFILVVLIVIGVAGLDIQPVKEHDIAENKTIVSDSPKSSDASLQKNTKDNENNGKSDKKNVSLNKDDKTDKKADNKKDNDKDSNVRQKKHKKKKKSKNASKRKKQIVSKKKAALKKDKKNSSNKEEKEKSVSKSDTSKKDTTKKDKTDLKENVPKEDGDEDAYIKCNVTIDCSILLTNMDKLDKNVRRYVPEDGKLLNKTDIKVKKDASAYDVLVAACKENKISYDAQYSAIYNSAYVKGIGYLYEKMAGDMSGWLYLVDGMTPNVGASAYKLKDSETVEWIYTCSGRAGS